MKHRHASVPLGQPSSHLSSRLKFAVLASLLLAPLSVLANTYTINRTWKDTGFSRYGSPEAVAILTGTVEIPSGNYTLDKNSRAPFTGIHLSLTLIDGDLKLVFYLTEAYTVTSGDAKMIIHADAKTLSFQHTGNAGSRNEAVLQFWDSGDLACYAIGQDSIPNAQAACCFSWGETILGELAFPQVFGTRAGNGSVARQVEANSRREGYPPAALHPPAWRDLR